MESLSPLKVEQNIQRIEILWLVLGLRLAFFLIELGVGIWSNSLSLLAGAGHLFSDLLTLGLILLAAWLVQHESLSQTAWNYKRLEAWVAVNNGLSLGAIACWIVYEAIKHLQTPQPVFGLPVLLVAGLGLVINGLTIQLLHPHTHSSLNFRGVFLHGVADAASSLSIILAACAVYFFDWLWADALSSLLVAILIGLGAISLIREGLQVLRFEAMPPY